MEIVIDGPFFLSAEDEELFFSCIYSLPLFAKVAGEGIKLHIQFKKAIPTETIKQLHAICERWEIDTSSLPAKLNL